MYYSLYIGDKRIADDLSLECAYLAWPLVERLATLLCTSAAIEDDETHTVVKSTF